MKWIKCSDQPPAKGALVARHTASKQLLDNISITTDEYGNKVVRQDWDENSEEYLLEMVEWLDESPQTGLHLICECGLNTKIGRYDIDYSVDYNTNDEFDGLSNLTVGCKCGKETTL